MKRFAVAVLLLISGFALSGQNKGDMYVSGMLAGSGGRKTQMAVSGGIIGADSFRKTVLSTPRLSFSPEFGYFVADKCAVRAGISYGFKRVTATSVVDDVSTTVYGYTHMFTFDPGVSYYAKICNKFYYRPGLTVSVGASKEISRTLDDDGQEIKKSQEFPFYCGISIDIAVFEVRAAEHFGIMFQLGDLGWDTNSLKKSKMESAIHLRLAVKIGFQYYL